MPSPENLGASGRYLEIELAGASYPLLFAPLFAAAYPLDARQLTVQAVSRTIVAFGGSSYIDFITAAPGAPVISFPFVEGEANAIQAVGVNSEPMGVTSIKVFL